MSPEANTEQASGAEQASRLTGPQGRQHFQQQLQELESRALGGLDVVLEQLDRTRTWSSHRW